MWGRVRERWDEVLKRKNKVEGLPWVPDRPTLGSRFSSGLCQVPAHKTVSCGFPRVFRFPQLLLKPEEVYPRFPSQQEVSVGSVSNRGRRWVLADRSTGEHSCACTWTWTQIHQKGYVPDAARLCQRSAGTSAPNARLRCTHTSRVPRCTVIHATKGVTFVILVLWVRRSSQDHPPLPRRLEK